MKIKHKPDHPKSKRAPLWKWVLIILLIIGMPLFFWFIRMMQMQKTLDTLPAAPENIRSAQSSPLIKP